jgi:hypothetical protein
VHLTLNVTDDLSAARVVWEAAGQEPSFGETFSFTPGAGNYWVEAEAQWPDGRRIFATNSIAVLPQAIPALSNPQIGSSGQFTFMVSGVPLATYVIQASTDLSNWNPIATNTLPAGGVINFSDPAAPKTARYYRALQMP